MSAWLLVAVILAVALGLAHSILGERYLLIRLFRREDLPRLLGSREFTVRTMRFAWHLTSVAFWGFAALLALLALGAASPANVALTVAITFLLSGVIALVASRARHLSWIAFFAIGGIALWAAATA